MTAGAEQPVFRLDGQTVVVTGASSGIGRHLAGVFARAGARIVATARRQHALEEFADEWTSSAGPPLTLGVDVCDPQSVAAAIETVVDSLGRIDVVVNNAGVAITKPLGAQSLDDWDRVIDTNLRGAWLVARAAVPAMAAAGGGVILNVASVLGLRGTGQLSGYVASKHGLVGLTHALAVELARDRIRVNALAPGYVSTDLNADFLASDAGQRLRQRIPLRRFAELGDLDGPALLLASPAGGYLTGVVLPVDGGHTVSL